MAHIVYLLPNVRILDVQFSVSSLHNVEGWLYVAFMYGGDLFNNWNIGQYSCDNPILKQTYTGARQKNNSIMYNAIIYVSIIKNWQSQQTRKPNDLWHSWWSFANSSCNV